jgi:hypothetical protein
VNVASDYLAKDLAALMPVEVPDVYADGVAFWLDVLAQHVAIYADIPLPDETEIPWAFEA